MNEGTASPAGPPAGWYPSQSNPQVEVYWDGRAWTAQTRSAAKGTPGAPQNGGDGYVWGSGKYEGKYWNGRTWVTPTPGEALPPPEEGMAPRSGRGKWILVAVAGIAALILIGVFTVGSDTGNSRTDSGSSGSGGSSTGDDSADAPWLDGKYSLTVKQRIDSETDCVALQAEFDQAAENDGITRNRTGSGTADLMGYIDDRMREVGCY